MLEVISRKAKSTLRGTSHSLCYYTADNNNDSNSQKDLISWTLDSGGLILVSSTKVKLY